MALFLESRFGAPKVKQRQLWLLLAIAAAAATTATSTCSTRTADKKTSKYQYRAEKQIPDQISNSLSLD